MYGCNCDGVEKEPLDVGGGEGVALRSVLTMVEKVSGHRPPTCPWRAFYEPIVQEIMPHAWATKDGNTSSLGSDPDAKLLEALGIYHRSRRSTENEDQRLAIEDERRKREHAAAAHRSRRG